MNKFKVSEATNTQLDWLVAKCEGLLPHDAWVKYGAVWWKDYVYSPTTDPARMWPIIERERISIRFWDNTQAVHAYMPNSGAEWSEGPTSLIAAARCYVASKLGEEVEVPEELM